MFNAEEYPEGHSPFCFKDCDHPCHDAYDEEQRQKQRFLDPMTRERVLRENV